MKGDVTYQRPKIETVPADRLLELLGPVSAGSHKPSDLLLYPRPAVP